ncbi:MAG: diaminopimelate epimerase [Flavobacteriales bacterium]|nr:diaminopimelate epimerase [Flavobacteriales bacterium]
MLQGSILSFSKYQGTGNDFIMINNMKGSITLTSSQIQWLCDRRFGIGSDGVILIEKSGEADFYVNFYNPDGSQSFCGNGSRCAVSFAIAENISDQKGAFSAIDGLHQFSIIHDQPEISMNALEDVETVGADYYVNTGSPHYVQVVNDVSKVDVLEEGAEVRYSDSYKPGGTNVNFVEWMDDGLKMRTYERGVEGETLSCGTGVTAAALVHQKHFGGSDSRRVITEGGELAVRFSQGDESQQVWLKGPAKKVFQGDIKLEWA